MTRFTKGVSLAFILLSANLSADSIFNQTNLASDISGLAANLDPNLKNPWGVSFTATSPFWVSNQVTNTATLYNATGVPQALVVTTPPGPTGQVANGGTGFELTAGNPARFIFSSLSGTVSGWNPAVAATTAVTKFTATDGAAYTGLASATVNGSTFLYAADTANGKIDVLNSNFQKVSLSGSFMDPQVPSSFHPYNIQLIGNMLYVTYSIRDTPGGYVGVFDLNGNLVQHISDSHFDEPWGLVVAPPTFGTFGNALLVGNEGNGIINGFNPTTGTWLGTISGASGPLVNEGLWALEFRAGGSTFDPNALYFVAGINDEANGLFGTITPAAVPEPATLWTSALVLSLLVVQRRSATRRQNGKPS